MTSKNLLEYGIYATRTIQKRCNLQSANEGKQRGGSHVIKITLPDIDFERNINEPALEPGH